MSSPRQGAVVARVFREYRAVVLPLVALLAINVAVFIMIVLPLSQRVGNVEERTRAAERSVAAAQRAHADAGAALQARERGGERLQTFYGSVLPADFTSARRLLQTRPWEMGEQMGLMPRSVRFDEVVPREQGLVRFRASMDFSGSYADVRSFIRRLETAPEFVIIDDVQIQEGRGEGTTLGLRMGLSTYYRANGR